MRHILTASAFLSVLALSAPARAEEPVFPSFAELPTGTMTAPPPESKATHLSARESVPGFFVVVPKDQISAAGRRVLVFGDAKSAAAAAKSGSPFSDTPASTCFSSEGRGRRTANDDDRPFDWSEGLGPSASIWASQPFSGATAAPALTAVHLERLSVSADGTTASLEATDAWIDTTTRGARLVAKSTLPLKQIGTLAGGRKIFAGRDERADGRRGVQFVITRGQDTLAAQLGRMFARRLDGDVVQDSGCAHFRMGIPLTKDGESALVSTSVMLPSLDGKEAPTLAQLQGVRQRGARANRVVTTPFGSRPISDEPEERELRLRDVGIQLSVSQTSRDKEPVISVSQRWLARERTPRVFVPRSGPE
jgi:hypothetical protein